MPWDWKGAARASGTAEEAVRPAESRHDLLRRLEPELRGLFDRYGVPPARAEEVVTEGLLVLGARQSTLDDRERRLLDSVRRECERLLAERLEAAHGPAH